MSDLLRILSLVVPSFVFSYFYLLSVRPAALEKKIGEFAYEKCGMYRKIAMVFELVTIINYILIGIFPLDIWPAQFPWNYYITLIIALIIGIPSLTLMIIGMKDAGMESLTPLKEQEIYKGIYKKIRHPQALGELVSWWFISLLLNSVFLTVYSLIWIPIFYWFCKVEEQDLVIRFGESYKEYQEKVGMFFPKTK